MAAGASPSMAGRGTPPAAVSASRISSSTSATGLSRREQPALRLGGDDQLRLGIRDDVGDLALPIQDVDRDEHHAGLHAGEEEIDELEPVRQLNREPIARLEPAPAQHRRDPRRAVRDLAERQLPPTAGPVTDQADRVPGVRAGTGRTGR